MLPVKHFTYARDKNAKDCVTAGKAANFTRPSSIRVRILSTGISRSARGDKLRKANAGGGRAKNKRVTREDTPWQKNSQ